MKEDMREEGVTDLLLYGSMEKEDMMRQPLVG